MSEQETIKVVDDSSYSWKIFDAFVNDGQISLSEDEIRDYAIKELKMVESEIPPELVNCIPKLLIAFMNCWPGWHFKDQYKAGEFSKIRYYKRFNDYMIYKAANIIKGKYLRAMKSVTENIESTKLELVNKKDKVYFAPYAIHIQCPSSIVNTLVFANEGDDIIMKQHLGPKWLDLSNIQLLNWPQVQVTFHTQDIFFQRTQATEFLRYLNFFPHESYKQPNEIIENVERKGSQRCYSCNYLEVYFNIYIDSIKSLPSISPTKLHEIQTILSQFLEDIRYININKSIATNTTVLFRLSEYPFVRNKKLVKSSDQVSEDKRVGYCEIITPKVELSLHYFKPQCFLQENPYSVSFKYPEMIRSETDRLKVDVMPSIAYKCTYCNMEYTGPNSSSYMLEHMKTQHKMEQNVRCTVCKKQFEVVNLAACRWKHKCVPENVNQ